MLENVPWAAKRVDLSLKSGKRNATAASDEGRPTSQSTTAAAAAAAAADKGSKFPVELRWGVAVKDMRALWALHEKSFPLSYDLAYYQWLLQDTCLCLTAYTTPEALQALEARGKDTTEGSAESKTNEGDKESEGTCESEASMQEVSATIAATEARLRGDFLADAGFDDMEAQTRTMAEVDQFITELEYQEERDARTTRKEGEGKRQATSATSASAAAPVATGEHIDNGKEPAVSDCTAVVGFICGQIVFAADALDRLFTNPTGYIGSIAVLPAARCLGVGAELLDALLSYMLERLPLHASSYLHYEEREMRSMAWRVVKKDLEKAKAMGKAKEGEEEVEKATAATAGQEPKEKGKESYGFWETLAQFTFPEAAAWFERRRARRELMAGGMTMEEADSEVARRTRDASIRVTDAVEEEDFFSSLSEERRRALLDPVVQVGVREVWLHCLADDVPLKRFYQRRNFTVAIERTPKYYEFGGAYHDASVLLYTKQGTTSGGSNSSKSPSVEVDGKAVDGVPTGVVVGAATTDLATMAEQKRRERLAQQQSIDAKEKQLQEKEQRQQKEGEGETATAATTLRRRSNKKHTAGEGGHGAAGDAGETDTAPSPTATATAAAGKGREDDNAQWLSPATYRDVKDIRIMSVGAARKEWVAVWGRRRALMRRLREERRPLTWRDHVTELALTLNALACLIAVLYFWYNYGAK